ncbi:MAG: hypothetical protein AB9880_06255 [Christensenellales bacterium]
MPFFSKKQAPVVRDNMTLTDLLHEAKVSDDPVYAKACLDRAEILAPDSIAVQRALLMHGRLHERGKVPADYHVIKCYLLHAFEHPEAHSAQEQQRMAEELFSDPRLLTCLRLSEDSDAFLRAYLAELCQEYMRIFILSDGSHAPRVFGISNKSQLHRYLAVPTSDTIRSMLSSPWLDAAQQRLAARAFYEAFSKQMDGQTKELDRLLGAEICQTLA